MRLRVVLPFAALTAAMADRLSVAEATWSNVSLLTDSRAPGLPGVNATQSAFQQFAFGVARHMQVRLLAYTHG
jgi:hypothetical protein